mmetsp:Transcript_2417/g.4514  ORF Transcript_2417/g.4514 Transcript_2417/m.4514 type:complete len:697 (+) Transcript_2417:131-2221(+)
MAALGFTFSLEQLMYHSPSRALGMDYKKELMQRRDTCNMIASLGKECEVGQLTIATASVYFHLFFACLDLKHHDRKIVGAACLFLAAKVEEKIQRVSEILEKFFIINRVKKKPIRGTPEFEKYKQVIYEKELLLLDICGYQFKVQHPYTYMMTNFEELFGPTYANQPDVWKTSLKTKGGLVQQAWFFVNDSLRSTLCLQYKPEDIAIAVMFLALKKQKQTLTKHPDVRAKELAEGKNIPEQPWYQERFGKSEAFLKAITKQIIEVIEQPGAKTAPHSSANSFSSSNLSHSSNPRPPQNHHHPQGNRPHPGHHPDAQKHRSGHSSHTNPPARHPNYNNPHHSKHSTNAPKSASSSHQHNRHLQHQQHQQHQHGNHTNRPGAPEQHPKQQQQQQQHHRQHQQHHQHQHNQNRQKRPRDNTQQQQQHPSGNQNRGKPHHQQQHPQHQRQQHHQHHQQPQQHKQHQQHKPQHQSHSQQHHQQHSNRPPNSTSSKVANNSHHQRSANHSRPPQQQQPHHSSHGSGARNSAPGSHHNVNPHSQSQGSSSSSGNSSNTGNDGPSSSSTISSGSSSSERLEPHPKRRLVDPHAFASNSYNNVSNSSNGSGSSTAGAVPAGGGTGTIGTASGTGVLAGGAQSGPACANSQAPSPPAERTDSWEAHGDRSGSFRKDTTETPPPLSRVSSVGGSGTPLPLSPSLQDM